MPLQVRPTLLGERSLQECEDRILVQTSGRHQAERYDESGPLWARKQAGPKLERSARASAPCFTLKSAKLRRNMRSVCG